MASSGNTSSKSTQPSKPQPSKPQSIQEEAHHPGVTQQGTEPASRGERRRQQFEQKRVERKQAPARQQRDQLLLRIGGIVLALLVLFGAGYGIYSWLTTRDDNREPAGVVSYNYTGGQHSPDKETYTESPPVGGVHNPVWQTCNYYAGVIPNENAVHSLEHGAVWITYRPDISESDRKKLEGWAKERPYLLVSEYDKQDSPFVFTAWNNQLPVDSLSSKAATQFMNYFIQGAQTPERGASCSGGNTSTIG